MVHELKCWDVHYDAIASGIKTADVRATEDRTFDVGDEVIFTRVPRPGHQATDAPYGTRMLVVITHITEKAGPLDLFGVRLSAPDSAGQLAKVVVLSFRRAASVISELHGVRRVGGAAR